VVGGWVSSSGKGLRRFGSAIDEGGGVSAVSAPGIGNVEGSGCVFPCDGHPPCSLQWCLQRWLVHPFRMRAELHPLVRHLTSVTT
jgi:hypothetical protein